MKKHMTTGILVLAAAGSLSILGCTKKESESASASDGASAVVAKASVNSICPMTGEAVDGEHTAEFQGQTIGFCCDDCEAAWNKLSDDKKAEKLAQLGDTAKEKAEDAADKAKEGMKGKFGDGG